jgi:CheY-like chemotaxis protein
MSTLLIQTNEENAKLLKSLARKLGAKVSIVSNAQLEDLAFGGKDSVCKNRRNGFEG